MSMVILVLGVLAVFGGIAGLIWALERTLNPKPRPKLDVRTPIFLARLRDWDDSLSGGLPDDMRAELDDLLKRAGVRQLPKGE
jgi:hypothetical protein